MTKEPTNQTIRLWSFIVVGEGTIYILIILIKIILIKSGKSRFLDEFAKTINTNDSLIIPITYDEEMAKDSLTVTSMLDRFYYRMLYS